MSNIRRCNRKHPAMVAVNKVFALMEELGVQFYVGSGGRTMVYHQKDGEEQKEYMMKDDEGMQTREFPNCDFELLFERDEVHAVRPNKDVSGERNGYDDGPVVQGE